MSLPEVNKFNPKFNGVVGQPLSVDIVLPTILSDMAITPTEWNQIPPMPPGLALDNLQNTANEISGNPVQGTIIGTPTQAGTYELIFSYSFPEVFTSRGAPSENFLNQTILLEDGTRIGEGDDLLREWLVTVHIEEAAATNDRSACFGFNAGYCLKSIVTDTQTYSLGSGITGATLADLSDTLNSFFGTADYPLAAQVYSGSLWITVTDGATLSSVTLCNDNTVNFSEIVAPTTTETNNEFFGKDDPGDAEYSYYTLINTCSCGGDE